MTRKRAPIRGFDDAKSTNSEADAIQRLNLSKGFGIGRDSVPPEQVLAQQPQPSGKSAIKGSDATEKEPVSEPATAAPPSHPAAQANTYMAVDPKNGTITLSPDALEQTISTAIARNTQELQSQLKKQLEEVDRLNKQVEEEQDKLDQAKAEYEVKLKEEAQGRNRLAEVFLKFGLGPDGMVQTPSDTIAVAYSQHQDKQPAGGTSYIAPLHMRGGVKPRDAYKEYERILDDGSAMNYRSVTTPTGTYEQRDTRHADRWLLKNRDALRSHLEEVAKGAGLLRGKIADSRFRDAVTTFANFPAPLREYLSAVIRIEHSARFVLWQFVNRNIDTGIQPGQTTLVPRVKHLNAGTTSGAWRLTPGTPTAGTRQNLTGNNISIRIEEFGMGKDADVEPVAVSDLVMLQNLMDIEMLLSERVGYNYHQFEELAINELLLSSTQNIYNNGGSAVGTAAGVTAGGGGQITQNFLGSLRARMANDKVPPLPDGAYIFVGTPDHIAQIENDIQIYHSYSSPPDFESLTNLLAAKTRNEYTGRVQGYKGKIRGFHVFEGTGFSSGTPGTPGVQTETLGGTAVTTRTAFAMGDSAVGWATSLPMELRDDPGSSNFGRISSLIWKSHEGYSGLDIDPARTLLTHEVARPVGAEEQLRVYKVRSSTVAV